MPADTDIRVCILPQVALIHPFTPATEQKKSVYLSACLSDILSMYVPFTFRFPRGLFSEFLNCAFLGHRFYIRAYNKYRPGICVWSLPFYIWTLHFMTLKFAVCQPCSSCVKTEVLKILFTFHCIYFFFIVILIYFFLLVFCHISLFHCLPVYQCDYKLCSYKINLLLIEFFSCWIRKNTLTLYLLHWEW